MGPSKDKNQYSEKEAQRRFEAALRGGLNTPPKPLKDMPKRKANRRPRKTAAK